MDQSEEFGVNSVTMRGNSVNFWNAQAECASFYSKIRENFTTGKYTDVNVFCHDERVFQCHRLVLSAASQYFDAMFKGNFRESSSTDVNLHPDINSVTFEFVLEYMYSGRVDFIDDENVYNLLCASEILGLDTVEAFCIHYLSQCSIPMDSALDIFIFACATGKKSLIPITSRFILKHLRESAFSQLPLDELGCLLSHFRSYSSDEEKDLLNLILKCVLSCSTGARHDQKSLFFQLAQKCHFEYITMKYLVLYFSKNVGSCNCDEPATLMGVGVDNYEFCLQMYTTPNHLQGYDDHARELFTLRGLEEPWNSRMMEFSVSVHNMRTAVLGDRLYCLKYDEDDALLDTTKFDSCSSINLTSDLQSLTYPPINSSLNWLICSDERSKIYVSDSTNCLCVYEPDSDQWSTIDVINTFYLCAFTWFDRRLYLIGGENSGFASEMRAYDPRVGLVERLPNCKLPGYTEIASCIHRERIYLIGDCSWMRNYDPAAGKWNLIESNSVMDHYSESACQLASFDDRLWLFHCDYDRETVRVDSYDSYRQSWKTASIIDGLENSTLLDVVVYKSL